MTSYSNQRTGRVVRVLAMLLIVVFLAVPAPVRAQETPSPQLIHVVIKGENLYGIAARYGVPVSELLGANNLFSAGPVRPGTRLVVPAPPGQTGTVHTVRRGEVLGLIAAQYGVKIADIMLANGLQDANQIFTGQRLLIPVLDWGSAIATPTPAVARPLIPTPTPTIELPSGPQVACPGECEAISIHEPTHGVTVTSPFTITGSGLAFEQNLVVRVLDATGYEIGLGNAMIDGPLGEIGPYTGTINFTMPASAQRGRIQVYSLDPSDGAIEHLTSVVVTLAGSGLDPMIEQVKAAIEAKDYETLASSMTDPWALAFYRSEGLSLSAAKGLQELKETYLGPGKVFVDLSVNARDLLGDQVILSPDVTHIVYSTGWGSDQADDALLLFETDASGQTLWGGLLYIFDALKDYE